jgi:Skp family chaperone for outer membrane proteins
MMKKITVFIVLATIVTTSFAQQTQNLAYYNADSILLQWPAFHVVVDSLERTTVQFQYALGGDMNAYVEDSIKLHNDSARLSKEQYAARREALDVLDSTLTRRIAKAEKELWDLQNKLVEPLNKKLDSAALEAATKKGLGKPYDIYEAKEMAEAPGANYHLINITDAVMLELGIPEPKKKKKK